MILADIYRFLSSDAALGTILASTEHDSRIYPNFAKEGARTPFIVYRSLNPGGSRDEVLCEENVSFEVTAESYSSATAAVERLFTLLDMVSEGAVPSLRSRIFYAKLIGGADFVDDMGRHIRAANYVFKFKKTGGNG